MDEMIERLGQRFADEPLEVGPYEEQIRSDAVDLLQRCGLPKDSSVWEIQWENGEFVLLLMGRENKALDTVQEDLPVHVREADAALCEGLMRAAFAARRMGVSLGRLLLEAMEE